MRSDFIERMRRSLLDIETVFQTEKQTCQIKAEILDDAMAPGTQGESISGYEIHVGHTTSSSSWLRIANTTQGKGLTSHNGPRFDGPRFDGARSEDGRVWGCYLHGLFHNDRFRSAWLYSLGVANSSSQSTNANESINRSLDRMADAFESNIDMDQLEKIIWNQERVEIHVG